MGRIGMSQKELRRVEVLARVKRRDLKVADAASLVEVSYRQAKRLWKRYREEGAAGLQHRSAGCRSNRAHDEKFRQKVLRRVRGKYGGEVSTAGAAASAEQVQRSGGRALWSDAGGRALGIRGRTESARRNAAAVDAGGRLVESPAETAAAPSAARWASALGRRWRANTWRRRTG